MLVKILLVVAALVLLFVIVAAMRPDSYSVERSTVINAPPAVVYGEVADFHAWQAWSPWGKIDPAMKTSYSGDSGKPGAVYEWSGDDKVGEGRMTILQAQAPASLEIKLDFIRPFSSTSTTGFSFNPSGAGTLATWTMSGKHNFMMKAMGIFMSMDKMIGGDFEKGLAQLKEVSETAAKAATAAAPAAAPMPAAAK